MWLKLAAQLVPPEKILKILGGAVIVFFSVFVFLASSFTIYKHVPLGKTPEEYNFYIRAAQRIQAETGVLIPWHYIMAIDAVILQQDFSKSSEDHAYGYKSYFVQEEKQKIERTCMRKKNDLTGKTYTETYDCSYEITVYKLRPFEETLERLIQDGKLTKEDKGEVLRYLQVDWTSLVGTDQMPPGWTPIIHNLAWPTDPGYPITSKFGLRIDPITFQPAEHEGIDIGAPEKTPVYAIADGTVVHAGYRGTAGIAVILNHGQLESRYYHLRRVDVRQGENVHRGQKIGEVGDTGRSTGPHLHFEILVQGRPTDPITYYQ